MQITRWTLGLALAAVGCGAIDEGETELAAALPRAEDLALVLPGGSAGKAPLGEPAALYVLTRRTTDRLNGLVGGLVGTIGDLASQPPRAHRDGHAEWGPFTPSLSPITYRLVADRVDDGVDFHLDARPKGGGDFVVVIAGASAADGHAGGLRFEIDRLRGLDPVAELPPVAAIAAAYERRADGATITVDLGLAHYAYGARADGGGDFAFSDGGVDVHTRWTAGGAGRGEAGGVVECWDESFRSVACADVP